MDSIDEQHVSFVDLLNHGLEEDITINQTQEEPIVTSQIEFSKKNKNFLPEEDLMLVSAWIYVSTDAAIGNDQRRATMWGKISDYFHENRTFFSDRTLSSLMHRWSSISASTNKFCGYYEQISRRRQSGTNELDWIQQSKEMFTSLKGTSFAFEHCWMVLRHHPKWIALIKKKTVKPVKTVRAGISATTPLTPGTPIIGSETPETCVGIERPSGRDAAKQSNKRKNTTATTDNQDSVFTKDVDKMIENRKKMHIENQSELKLLREDRALEREERRMDREQRVKDKEDEIMAKDVTSMSPSVRIYWEHKQMEIIKKYDLSQK